MNKFVLVELRKSICLALDIVLRLPRDRREECLSRNNQLVDEFFQFISAEHLIAFAKTYRSHFGHLWFDVSSVAPTCTPGLLLKLATSRIWQTDRSLVAVDALISRSLRLTVEFLESESALIIAYAPISEFGLAGRHPHHFEISVGPETNLSTRGSIPEWLEEESFEPELGPINRPLWAVNVTTTSWKILPDAARRHSSDSMIDHISERLFRGLAAVRTYDSIALSGATLYEGQLVERRLHYPVGTILPAHNPGRGISLILDRTDLDKFILHCRVVTGQMHPALRIALGRLSEATASSLPRYAIVEAVSGLEAILLFKMQTEASHRFCMNYALLHEPSDRLREYSLAKEVYSLRSAIVHGHVPNRSDEDKMYNLARQSTQMLWKVLSIFIGEGASPSFVAPNYWRDLALGIRDV